jgi:hypothetical protein
MPTAAATAGPIQNRPLKWQIHESGGSSFTINQRDQRGFSLIANVSGATPENARMLKAAPELLRAVKSAVGVLDSAFAREQSPVVTAALRQLRKSIGGCPSLSF